MNKTEITIKVDYNFHLNGKKCFGNTLIFFGENPGTNQTLLARWLLHKKIHHEVSKNDKVYNSSTVHKNKYSSLVLTM